MNIRILILLFFRRTENSETRAEAVNLKVVRNGDWSAQYEGKIKRRAKVRFSQFRGINKDEAGSKIENKLFIISRLGFWF
jgi:hypothetical protein